jgi:hypothetical protein
MASSSRTMMIGLLQSGTGIGRGICLPMASSGLLAVCVLARDARAAWEPWWGKAGAAAAVEARGAIKRPARCRWRGVCAERRVLGCGCSPAPFAGVCSTALAAREDGRAAEELGVEEAGEPPELLAFEEGASGDAGAPAPLGAGGGAAVLGGSVGPAVLGGSVGLVVGALGTDTPTLGTDTLTLGTDTLTPGTDTLTPGTDTLTPGTDTLTLGKATPTDGVPAAGALGSATLISDAPTAIATRLDRRAAILSHRFGLGLGVVTHGPWRDGRWCCRV